MAKEEHKKPAHHKTHTAHKKVMDVTRPGKAPASPTSRPVIASPKPPVADDQFVPSAPPLRASDPYAKHDLMDSKNRKGLQPLGSAGQDDRAEVSDNSSNSAVASAPALPTSPAAQEKAAEIPSDLASTQQPAVSLTQTPTAPLTPEAEPKTGAAVSADTSAVTATDGPAEALSSAPTVPVETTAPSTLAETPAEVPASAQEETPAHLALEQTVDTSEKPAENNVPIWEHPDTSEQVETTPRTTHTSGNSKSIEDLLAETGAPVLEPEQSPSLIISHHKQHHRVKWWQPVLIFLLIVVVAAVVVDVLLDLEVIRTSLDLPHTDLF